MTLREALKQGIGELRAANVGSPALAAELLLMHVLGCARARLYTRISDPIDPAALERYRQLVGCRAAGTPTQYLTGTQEFWSLEFEVTPDVLIPRPETEHVVEVALERVGWRRLAERLRVVDVGTGAGCLAVALAHELPEARVFAVDISRRALAVASRNAARNGAGDRIAFVEGNLLAPFAARAFNLAAVNPPYVGRRDAASLPREVREHEPAEALFAGEEGIEIYPLLVAQAAERLVPGGTLVMELGYGASARVQALMDPAEWRNVAITNDLAGIPRVLAADRA
ncbi:MAG TPA: peptide chain release factor N(5)-glutamine methyltransferase [Candidatus Acidoferrales bacterium]|nr:peptide chain release factor N(5)-glutamine methyltransferase [Candidatus Acidoferrales bacterium]